jgi:hypothetical protein
MRYAIMSADGVFFVKVRNLMGQPSASGAEEKTSARLFPTPARAEAFRAKYLGTGCGMERFTTVVEMPDVWPVLKVVTVPAGAIGHDLDSARASCPRYRFNQAFEAPVIDLIVLGGVEHHIALVEGKRLAIKA